MSFPASFNLALRCCSCMHHLLPCVAPYSLVMHHTWLSIMPCSCVVCLPCCVLLLDSSRFCCDREDSFVYAWFVFVASSSSWTHSSSQQDFRQDDHHLGSHYYHCYARLLHSIALLCYLSPDLQASQFAMSASNLFTLPSKPLFGYVTAFAQPLLQHCQLQVKLKIAPWWTGLCWDITISLI